MSDDPPLRVNYSAAHPVEAVSARHVINGSKHAAKAFAQIRCIHIYSEAARAYTQQMARPDSVTVAVGALFASREGETGADYP